MPTFGNPIVTGLLYLAVLLVIVFVHEMGHYLVGRWCGIKAKVFSLGIGKVLWSREDKHGTHWQIAALPLGGYVKFVGDGNAASAETGEAVELSPEERRHSLTYAPLWARFLTVLAGPVFNFIFAAIVFAIMMLVSGVSREPLTVGEISPRAPSGLMAGDVIVKIAGEAVPIDDQSWDDFYDSLPVNSADVSYDVLRNGNPLTVSAPHPLPALVAQVQPLSGARAAGVLDGDWIIAADGEPLPTFKSLMAHMDKSQGAPTVLTIRRIGAAEPLQITVQPKQNDVPQRDGSFERRWLLGVQGDLSFKPQLVSPSPL
ncbi:MAG: site-2 protease family protein, partial [Deltaproteobacteria bacterium]